MAELTPHPFEEPGLTTRFIEPCLLVIFGATGDLTAHRLLPAIYNLGREGQLPSQFACVGFARKEKSHAVFRQEMKSAIDRFSRTRPTDEPFWTQFQEKIFYHACDFQDDAGYLRLKQLLAQLDAQLGTRGNRVFYLSTQPSFFSPICEKLHQHGLVYDAAQVKDRWSRVIIEKPFGHDLTSAIQLQKSLLQFLKEEQIFRIDHYLGKETVQNILVFRFANSFFESLWNSRYIDHVQITVAEDIGIGTRGAFYEEEGLVRDIVQNHMMQLISLVAMEPPVSLKADDVRNEKVKVLQALRIGESGEPFSAAVRGQYGPGLVNGREVFGYKQETNVRPHSSVETYAAICLYIENWRWAGVPFYLRGGKRLPKRASEIAIIFKDPPSVLFQEKGKRSEPNVLALRLQPDEGSSLKMNCKVPGPQSPIQPVKMDFRYGSYFGMARPEAYERLILDCILGDSTLFAREDEVFTSWRLFTPILEHWAQHPVDDFPNYAAGTWGPSAAEQLLAKDRRQWRWI